MEKSKMKKLKIRSPWAREILAEFTGTFILMVFGQGSVAQSVLSNQAHGNYFTVNWGYGLGVMLGAYIAGGVSGAHLNPAVTLALAVTKKFSWRKVPAYFLGQYLGAFVASVVVYIVYYDALQTYTGGELLVVGPNATASIWSTYPAEGISRGIGFIDQIVGTALLLLCIRALADERNMAVPNFLMPFLVGLLVLGIGLSFGHNAGYAINPARDFAPRLFTLMCGYGTEVFSAYNYWFYIPFLAPHLGGILGSILYEVLVNFHWPDEEEFDLTLVRMDNTAKTLDSLSINTKEEKSTNN